MKGVSRLSHIRKGDYLWMGVALLFALYLIRTLYFFDPEFGMIKCVVSNCTENSIRMGDGEIEFVECTINKNNCSTNCYLATKYFSKPEFGDLDIRSADDCEYVRGKTYLGEEILLHIEGEREELIWLSILIFVIPVLWAALFYNITLGNRKNEYLDKKDDELMEQKIE